MFGVVLVVLVTLSAVGLMLWLMWVDYQDESAHRRKMAQASAKRLKAHAEQGTEGFD